MSNRAKGGLLMGGGVVLIAILIIMIISVNQSSPSNYDQGSIDAINNTGRCLLVLGPALLILGLVIFASGGGSKKTQSSPSSRPVTPSRPQLTLYSDFSNLFATSVAEPSKGVQIKPAISDPRKNLWAYVVTVDLGVLRLSLDQFCEQYYSRLYQFLGHAPFGVSSGAGLATALRGPDDIVIATLDKLDIRVKVYEKTLDFHFEPGRTYWPTDPRLTPPMTMRRIQKENEERADRYCYPLAQRFVDALR